MHLRYALQSPLLIVVFSLACLNSAAADDTLSMQFNWSAGIRVEVSHQKTTIKSQDGKEQSKTETNGSYTLSTTQVKDGIQIDFKSNISKINHNPPLENNLFQDMAQRLNALYPSYVVSNEGALLRVSKLKEYQSVLQQQIDTIISGIKTKSQSVDDPEMKNGFEGIKNRFGEMLTEEALYRDIQLSWQRDVSQWVGFTAEVGTEYETELTTSIPMLGNKEIPVTGVRELLGGVDCNAEAGAGVAELNSARSVTNPACVELKYTSFLDSDAASSTFAVMLEPLGLDTPENFTIKIDKVFYLITEPNSLLPHSSLEIDTTVANTSARPEAITRIERTQHKYTYLRR